MEYIQIYTRNPGGIIYRQFVLLQAPNIHKTTCIHSLDMKRLKHGILPETLLTTTHSCCSLKISLLHSLLKNYK